MGYIRNAFDNARAAIKQSNFQLMASLQLMNNTENCMVRILPSPHAAEKAATLLHHFRFDLRLKTLIESMCYGKSNLPKPKFNDYIEDKEEFVDVLIVRCAYLTINFKDPEVLNLPAAICDFLQAASTPELKTQLDVYGLGEISAVAIAANFWRFHYCGQPVNFFELPKKHDCATPTMFNAKN